MEQNGYKIRARKENGPNKEQKMHDRSIRLDDGSESSRYGPTSPFLGGRDMRKNSYGAYIQDLKDARDAAEEKMLKHQEYMREKLVDGDAKNAYFVFIHFSTYGSLLGKVELPGEVGLTAFSIKEGIVGNYAMLIDPYTLPLGIGIDARERCELYGIPVPPFSNRCQDYTTILTKIEAFIDHYLAKNPAPRGRERNRELYCFKDEIHVVEGCFEWLYAQTSKGRSQMEVFSLGKLVRLLSDVGLDILVSKKGTVNDEVVAEIVQDSKAHQVLVTSKGSTSVTSGYRIRPSSPVDPIQESASLISSRATAMSQGQQERFHAGIFSHDAEVELFLSSYDYAFDGEIACVYHFNKEVGEHYCSLNVTNRRAYMILRVLATVFQVVPRTTKHFPSLKSKPDKEVNCRRILLNQWDALIVNEDDLTYIPEQRDSKKVAKKDEK